MSTDKIEIAHMVQKAIEEVYWKVRAATLKALEVKKSLNIFLSTLEPQFNGGYLAGSTQR